MKLSQHILVLAIFFFATNVFGQREFRPNEKVRSLKIAYITEELNLSSKEAEKFWPVYNEFDRKIRELERSERRKIRNTIKEAKGYENLSEDKAEEILKRIHVIEKQIVDTKFKMDKELSKIISKKKILRLRHIEREFVRNLMSKLRMRRRKGMENRN